MGLRSEFKDYLKRENGWVPKLLAECEKIVGVDREWIVYGAITLLAIYLIFGHFGELVYNVVSFAYPAFSSYKAVESSSTIDDKQWLKYWVVYASVSMIGFVTDKILNAFPFYWAMKTIGFIVLFCCHGTESLYTNTVGPIFKRISPAFDQADVTKEAAKAVFTTTNTSSSQKVPNE